MFNVFLSSYKIFPREKRKMKKVTGRDGFPGNLPEGNVTNWERISQTGQHSKNRSLLKRTTCQFLQRSD
jgi:hypothetical protein